MVRLGKPKVQWLSWQKPVVKLAVAVEVERRDGKRAWQTNHLQGHTLPEIIMFTRMAWGNMTMFLYDPGEGIHFDDFRVYPWNNPI